MGMSGRPVLRTDPPRWFGLIAPGLVLLAAGGGGGVGGDPFSMVSVAFCGAVPVASCHTELIPVCVGADRNQGNHLQSMGSHVLQNGFTVSDHIPFHRKQSGGRLSVAAGRLQIPLSRFWNQSDKAGPYTSRCWCVFRPVGWQMSHGSCHIASGEVTQYNNHWQLWSWGVLGQKPMKPGP